MVAHRTQDQADVLDMVARLRQADEKRAASMANAEVPEASADLEFPAEFYQYFTFVKAA
jgi:hypothetical protein